MITAEQVGRNLHLTVEGVPEPFIIEPLPGFAGERATQAFLETAALIRPPDQLEDVWQMVLDGVTPDGDPVKGGPNWTRIRNTLSLHEGEDVLHPAFYWQTTLGIDGVNEYLEVGGGLPGAKKVLQRLILTLGISPTQTVPGGALENLTQRLVPTPPTDPSTTTVDRLPLHKRGFKKSSKRGRTQG
jgi:hypothetical protein